MAFKLADLLFRISADTKKFDRGMAKSKQRVGGMTKAVSQFKNMLIGAFSIRIVAGFFKKIINLNKTFEKTMSGVRAISGATGAEFKKLEESAKELGSTTSRTASQVAQLQTEYAKLGFTTGEILAASAATIQLSEATGEDLAMAAESAGANIRAFGLYASQTQMVVDLMAKAFTSSALNLERWTEAMGYVAPIARAAGRSIQLTAAALSIMADAGIHGSRAGTALKRIFEETAESGKPFAESLRDLAKKGITLANAEDEVGRRAMAALLILSENVDKLDELKIAYDDAAGSAQMMADIQMDNLEGSMLRITSAIEGVALQAKAANTGLKKTLDFFVGIFKAQGLFVKGGYQFADIWDAPQATYEILKLEQVFEKTLKKWESQSKLTEDRIATMRSRVWNQWGQEAAILWSEMGQAHSEAYLAGMAKPPPVIPHGTTKAPGKVSTITQAIMPGGEIGTGLSGLAGAFEQNAAALQTATQRYADAMEPITQMNDVIRQSFVDLGVSLGEGLGNMLSGLGGFENAGDKILSAVGKFAGKFGALLIAIGIGEKEFLENIGNPVALIAIGATLVALGAVTKNLLANRGNAIGGSSGSAGTSSSAYSRGAAPAQLSFVLKGEDIHGSYNKTEERYNRLGTG